MSTYVFGAALCVLVMLGNDGDLLPSIAEYVYGICDLVLVTLTLFFAAFLNIVLESYFMRSACAEPDNCEGVYESNLCDILSN